MTNGIFVSLFNVVSLFMFLLLLSYVYKTQKMPAHWCIYKLMLYIHLIKYLFNISEYKTMLIKLLIYCNICRQEFNWLYKSPEGGQLKNQQPSKAPPPPQRKSARFLSITEQRNVTGTFLKRHSFVS